MRVLHQVSTAPCNHAHHHAHYHELEYLSDRVGCMWARFGHPSWELHQRDVLATINSCVRAYASTVAVVHANIVANPPGARTHVCPTLSAHSMDAVVAAQGLSHECWALMATLEALPVGTFASLSRVEEPTWPMPPVRAA